MTDESYFETVTEGDTSTTGGRTITEADVVNFAGVSGDFNHLHLDDERMAESSFGERIAHGMLVLSAATGLLWQDRTEREREALVAFYGIDRLRFRAPVFFGDRIHVDDFDEYEEWGNGIGSDGVGKPALTTWRSEDADTNLNAVVIRSPEIEEAAQNDEWLQASTDQGFMAYLNVCTHFCCIPGYKVLEESTRYDASDGTYCVCHQSVYDPFTLEEALFIARPRPEE